MQYAKFAYKLMNMRADYLELKLEIDELNQEVLTQEGDGPKQPSVKSQAKSPVKSQVKSPEKSPTKKVQKAKGKKWHLSTWDSDER